MADIFSGEKPFLTSEYVESIFSKIMSEDSFFDLIGKKCKAKGIKIVNDREDIVRIERRRLLYHDE